ncbi:unnamed protein product [Protopolystoma xenopodis]|uniref:Uncharacterized protein n=1 Tax=Protopolystoma xenopodis TaxID=117903 RepID=A0A3S5AMK3_9PLAT|nr:unnamed protein product [Protopolystoma xenopodis]
MARLPDDAGEMSENETQQSLLRALVHCIDTWPIDSETEAAWTEPGCELMSAASPVSGRLLVPASPPSLDLTWMARTASDEAFAWALFTNAPCWTATARMATLWAGNPSHYPFDWPGLPTGQWIDQVAWPRPSFGLIEGEEENEVGISCRLNLVPGGGPEFIRADLAWFSG